MTQPIRPEWIAVDCHEDILTAWAMRDGRALQTLQSHAGVSAQDPAATLAELVSDWGFAAATPVILCGDLWDAAPKTPASFRAVPCTPLPERLVAVPSDRFVMHRVPGLRQTTPSDLTAGAETRVAGFLALNPKWDGVICLPGRQSTWVHLSAGEVVSFQTYMTGTLLDLLSATSVLQAAVTAQAGQDAVFDATIEDALSRPEKLAARLFAIHADHVLDKVAPAAGKARLHGLLIGTELAAARPYWLGMNIAIIGPDQLASAYARALQTQGAPATVADADRMTLAGLTAAYRLTGKGA